MMVRPEGGLTQQARLLRTFVILASVALVLAVGSRAVAAGPVGFSSASPATVDTYAVDQGDTLWGIASSLAGPEDSTRALVDEILALNGMEEATLHVGEVILVPVAP